MDLIERGEIDFSCMRSLVLDEADRMLDMGFKEDIENIFKSIESEGTSPQIVLFSATIPPFVEEVAQEFMKTPPKYFDFVGDVRNKTSKTVKHYCFESNERD